MRRTHAMPPLLVVIVTIIALALPAMVAAKGGRPRDPHAPASSRVQPDVRARWESDHLRSRLHRPSYRR